jgi:hypothetical protein
MALCGCRLTAPPDSVIPAAAKLAILVIEPGKAALDIPVQAAPAAEERTSSFDFLTEEPEIYTDSDILLGRVNPRFRK